MTRRHIRDGWCRLDASCCARAGLLQGRDQYFDRRLVDTVLTVTRLPEGNGKFTITNRNTGRAIRKDGRIAFDPIGSEGMGHWGGFTIIDGNIADSGHSRIYLR